MRMRLMQALALAAVCLLPTPAAALTPTPTPNVVEVTPPTATASTHDGNVPGNTVDNNLATRWSAAPDGAWLQLSLGGPVSLRAVSIAVYRGNERKNRFDILSSTDGATWTPLLTNVL